MSELPLSVVFRADASIGIGWGHVMRCVTLAKAIVASGGSCIFLCRDVAGNLVEWIRAQGFEVLVLKSQTELTDAAECRDKLVASRRFDWLVVDSYQLGRVWELSMQGVAQRLMVIDDFSNRSHEADLLLNQNLDVTRDDYDRLTPAECVTCTGPEYALLRPEFAAGRDALLSHGERQKRLLVSMGGADAGDSTSWVLEALDRLPLPADWEIAVVMGGTAPALENVKKLCLTMSAKTDVFVDVTDMAYLMAASDLGIGAAGSTSWERCCMGLPSVLVALADNQKPIAEALERRGAAKVVALGDTLCLQAAVQLLVYDAIVRDTMSSRAAAICDGSGARRLLSRLSGITGET